MNKRIFGALSAVGVLTAGSLLTAGSAVANQDTGKAGVADPSAWVMPDVKGMVLFGAIQAVDAAAGGEQIKIDEVATGHRLVANLEDWIVCGESPGPGGTISKKKKEVVLDVERSKQAVCP